MSPVMTAETANSFVLTRARVEPWTGARVQARMTEAMATLRAVGAPHGPSQRCTSWPDIVRSANEAYGYTDAVGVRPRASPRDIARLEEVERWITKWLTVPACEAARLVPDTGWVLTCRALSWTYARIGRARKHQWTITHGKDAGRPRLPGGNSRPSLVAIERRGLGYVATKLNLAGVPVDPDTMEDR